MNKKTSGNKIIVNLVTVLFYSALICALVYYFRGIDWGKVTAADIDWKFLPPAALCSLALRFLHPAVWVFVLREFGETINNYWELNYVYAKSWLGRYIPGKVAWVGGKIFFGSRQGIDITVLTLGSLLESVIQLIANLFVGLFIIGLYTEKLPWSGIGGFAFVSLCVLFPAVYPPVFNKVIGIACRILKKKEPEARYAFQTGTLIKTLAVFVCLSVLAGIPTTLICRTVVPSCDVAGNFLYITGAANLAGALGILAIIAPGGLGVREGVFAVLFSVLFSMEDILIIVVFLRLMSIVVDFAFFLLSKCISCLLIREHSIR